ncbi:MAG: hypothetical protein ACRDYV_08720, partial [Acidimicrobiia bacterium]
MKALSLALAVTALALGILAWSAARSIQQIQRLERRDLRIEDLRGTIVHLDEVLTMSARMAAVTGDGRWEARYREFEPQLTEAIGDALALAPGTEAARVVTRTDAANTALVEMENTAFELIRGNQLAAAQGTLFSGEYDRQKAIYASGMNDLNEVLRQLVRQTVDREQGRVKLALAVFALALPVGRRRVLRFPGPVPPAGGHRRRHPPAQDDHPAARGAKRRRPGGPPGEQRHRDHPRLPQHPGAE